MASLRELQHSFAQALRDPGLGCAVTPAANLDIYRNNAFLNFEAALAASFPVLRQRVGAEYFTQLAHHFRERHPSRSGDLHWVGADFAEFLAAHLADGDYAWLADLARLERAREDASICIELEALGPEALARHAPDTLENRNFALQPSLRLIRSAYPVFSIWMANQADNAPPVDQSLGSEQGLVRIHHQSIEIRKLPNDLYLFLSALQSSSLGDAVAAAQADGPRLTELLGFAFANELVVSIS
jgi:hypothetical protein